MAENVKSLLDRAQEGDIDAFEKLIESHRKKVFNIALRMLSDYDDAADMAQEVFIRIYRSIKDFKQEAQFPTWVYRITTNVCLDELRKRKNKRTVSIDEEIKLDDGELKMQIEDDRPLPHDAVERNDIRKAVRDAIKVLPEHFRIIVILRDIQGMSYSEISKILKTPEGTVKSRINRARQALKDILTCKKELFETECVK
jgi:RNA polymerase sigma-70 factor, ECF subfamily